MLKSMMKTTAEELPKSGLLPTQENVQEQEANTKSGKLVNVERIEGTPFNVVTLGEDEGNEMRNFVAIGNKRITELMTNEEAKELIEFRNWDIIVQLIVVVAEELIKENQLNNK